MHVHINYLEIYYTPFLKITIISNIQIFLLPNTGRHLNHEQLTFFYTLRWLPQNEGSSYNVQDYHNYFFLV